MPLKNLTEPVPRFSCTDGHTAVLVLDVHRFTASPEHGWARMARDRGIIRELAEYYEQLEQVLPNIVRLVDGCRQAGLPAIFTRLVAATPDDVSAQARITGFWTTAGSPEAEFLAAPAPAPGETVVDKTTTSAFAATRLPDMLRARAVHHLIVCGVLAHGAVEHTARDAADRGFGVTIVADACAADTWTSYGFLMTTLVGGLIRTRTTSAVLEMVRGARA
ncbi:MAG: isochorismatase family cysteine hydrolase [Armatimonadota bacterium]|nr:isochorismatase family cysteine hydrolase [Armatimonadota bacterium]